jgi:hypothetical protein
MGHEETDTKSRMTPFIIILVAAPVVYWLFKRRQNRRADGWQHNKSQDVIAATAHDRSPTQVEHVRVPEEQRQRDHSTPDRPSAKLLPLEPQPLAVPASGSGKDDVVAKPAQEANAASTTKEELEPISAVAPFALPNYEVRREKNIAFKAGAGASIYGYSGAKGNPTHHAKSDENVAAHGRETATLWPTTETTHSEEALAAVTETPSSDRQSPPPPEPLDVSGGGEHDCLAEEVDTAPAGAGDFLNRTAAYDEIAPLRPTTEGGNLSSERLASAEVEPAKLEKIEVAQPARYRPPPQRQARRTTAHVGSGGRGRNSDTVLEIRVRLTLDRFGFCQISVLPERKTGMDDEIAVKAGAARLMLVAQEEWYGDLYFDDIGERLRQGIRLGGLLSSGRRAEWQLSGGRSIYVLAGHPSANGFVSVPRLALGRKHAVLCTAVVLEQAEAVLQQAGCKGYTKLDKSHGVPDGWTGVTGILPENALALDPGIDPFYALKPAPEIDINLEGGLLFHDAAWLSGYPPEIRVIGQTTGALKVLIDGKEAYAADGSYTAAGFDAPGQHLVECEGLSCSRSYSIEEPADSWEHWAAYAFFGADVCGPLVTLRPEARRNRLFTVPMSNPLLLGAEPGQVFRCSHRNVANWQGFVPFEVVWALPAQPLICDKKSSRILCFSSAPIAPTNRNAKHPLGWCSAILDAARKGLRIEGGSPESRARWIEYRKAARNVWRSRR